MSEQELIQRMAADLVFMPRQLEQIIQTAPLRYKKFYIKKSDGSDRLVAQPAREVKSLQYWILGELDGKIPLHEAARGYVKGSSIAKNAHLHSAGNFLLKMDFENFFPSILASDFKQHIRRHCGDRYASHEIDIMARALFWVPERRPPLRLCIGAPSSPFISNSIMFSFDEELTLRCNELGVIYSRYADDLAFSTRHKDVLKDVGAIVEEMLVRLEYPRLNLNLKKTIHASKKVRRTVTGINITPLGRLSVGRERKRSVRAMFHAAQLGLLNEKEMEILRGHLAFIEDVEPGFSEALRSSFERKKSKGDEGN